MKNLLKITALCALAAAALLLCSCKTPAEKPPGLKVSNGIDEIDAKQGTYSWRYGRDSGVDADSIGPLACYTQGLLSQIKPAADGRLSLDFEKAPQTVEASVYPESSAASEDYDSIQLRDMSGMTFTVPSDGMYIVNIHAIWDQGDCYYYFYTAP